ncbi:MAG: phosphoglycerate dehydrogenase [Gemmatimonadetes bacterium]|nr:phosphoglycerate dehydrogenase [Gemmatimonadota bacterium]
MTERIFVGLSTFVEFGRSPLDLLERSGFPFDVHVMGKGKRITTEELLTKGADATVIVAGVEPYDVKTLASLPRLRCISRVGVGVDAIDLAEAKRRGIAVANTPTIPSQAVAEMALACFLALSRNLRAQANILAKGRWDRLSAHLLSGRTIGLIGFGRIGQRVASLCRPFDARVIAHDPFGDQSIAGSLGVELVDMRALLSSGDIVSLHASRQPGQSVLLGDAELAAMKPGVVVVNLARGGMLDEDALVRSLRSGHVAGAALDVFAHEPYQGPLGEFEQVILTPHVSTLTVETRVAMEVEAVENALAFLAGSIPAARRVV